MDAALWAGGFGVNAQARDDSLRRRNKVRYRGPFGKGQRRMNSKTILALAMAASALAACNGAATNEAANAAGNAATNEAAAPANAAADAKPADAAPANSATAAPAGDSTTLDRAYLVGRWTDDGDCSAVTEFRADGSFLYPWGDTGQWTLAGDQLTLAGNTGAFTIRVIDANTLERTSAGGTPHRSTRCT
jgi:hypothetical protein